MVFRAWVHAATGLPSFYSDVDVQIETGGGRVVRQKGGTPVPFAVSDVLAQPGQPITYRAGGQSYELVRQSGGRYEGLVSRADGRPIRGLIYVADGGEMSWQADVEVFNRHVQRWALVNPLASGQSTFHMVTDADEAEFWRLLQAHEPLIIAPGILTPGAPVRVVVVKDVQREWVDRDGSSEWLIRWVETGLPNSRTCGPALLWRDYEALGAGWVTGKSYVDLLVEVAGMPSL